MPNDITNYLTLEGTSEDITAFFKKAASNNRRGESSVFTFNAFVTMPESELPNWNIWGKLNWGTSCDCYSVTVNSPCIKFDTAWTVPLRILIAMSRQFPTIVFQNEYIEEFVGSAGYLILRNGEIISQEHEEYATWANKQSKLIHQLNLKYCVGSYMQYLKTYIDDKDIANNSVFAFYYKKAKQGIS